MIGLHGILLIVTGILHIGVGLLPIVYKKDWVAFLKQGFWSTVSPENDRSMAAFWFVIAGPIMSMAGIALYEMEKNGLVSAGFGWAMMGVASAGVVMMPKSGFTLLLLPQALFYLSTVYG